MDRPRARTCLAVGAVAAAMAAAAGGGNDLPARDAGRAGDEGETDGDDHEASDTDGHASTGDDDHGASDDHDDGPVEERPRELVLGGFGLINTLVFGGAAFVRRRDRRSAAHRTASTSSSPDSAKDASR